MIMDILEKYHRYLVEERCMKERSVKDYIFIAKDLSRKLDILGVLSYKEVNDAIRSFKEAGGWSQGTVYKYSICVRHVFKWLVREGYRPDNPFPFSEWKKPRPNTPKFITQDLFDKLIDDPNLTHQELTLLYMLWDSGARIGEIAQLTQDHLDLEKGLVNIPYEISKGNYSYRNVPISQDAIRCLRMQVGFARRRGHEKAIFLGPTNESLRKIGMQKAITNIGLRQSPLRPLTRLSAHQFRHGFALRHLEKGIPQLVVSKWLGHESLQMTLRYLNLCSDSSRRLYDQFYQQA